jgi:hypothetical protein
MGRWCCCDLLIGSGLRFHGADDNGSPAGSWLLRGRKCPDGRPSVHYMCYQPGLMDERLFELARRDPYGALGLDPDPGLAFIGVRALRNLPTSARATRCAAYSRRGTLGRASPPGPASAPRLSTRSTPRRSRWWPRARRGSCCPCAGVGQCRKAWVPLCWSPHLSGGLRRVPGGGSAAGGSRAGGVLLSARHGGLRRCCERRPRPLLPLRGRQPR